MISVNLTTTSERLKLCRVALASLLMQTKLPDVINLWVSKKPYLSDKGLSEVDALNRLLISIPEANRHLVKIRWTPNTGPYRKLIPVLREAGTEDLIVTADDDIFYGENWLMLLLSEYERDPGKPVASRVRQIKYGPLGLKMSYMNWGLISERKHVVKDYLVTFGGGVILSKCMFLDADINDDSFLDVAPMADDIWYSMLLKRNKQRVTIIPEVMRELMFVQHPYGLANSNLAIGKTNFRGRILRKFWHPLYGAMGGAVCGNDHSLRSVERYFNGIQRDGAT